MDEQRLATARRRVLLDSNIWRYVIEATAQGVLIRAARSGSCEVQVAPAVLYEAMRTRDTAVRRQLISLMTHRNFRRLMPEAYAESMELVDEIRTSKPEWLKLDPDLIRFERLRKDWTRKSAGFWVRCQRAPDLEAKRIGALEGDLMQRVDEQFRGARKQMLGSSWSKLPSIDSLTASPSRSVPGWNGNAVQPWRIHAWNGFTYALARPGDAYRDWIGPWIDLDSGLLNSPEWVRFWLHETTAAALPRQWLRAMHDLSQRFRKVTSGSGGDNALFTYLIETDVIITADRAFLEILEEIRPFAPCLLPMGVLSPAGKDSVDCILGLIH